MTDKKISVYFNMQDKDGYTIKGLHTHVAEITPAQATQITKRLEFLPYPMRAFGLCKMTARISGNCLEINRTFDANRLDDEDYIMMRCTGEWCNCPTIIHKRCIQCLSNGDCVNKYMRDAVGSILFPQLYNMPKQR